MNVPSANHRKVYGRPVLLEYGSLSDLTLAVGNMGANVDGGTMSAQKTS